ncbi:hypothetical protein A7K94_0209730, partial [Modestobacter sp. VKM Ac-2676]
MTLLDATFARGPVNAGSGDAWLVALLEVEAALARAAARVGLVAETAAEEVGRVCADPTRLDLAGIAARAGGRRQP